jgi:hypothetical protein
VSAAVACLRSAGTADGVAAAAIAAALASATPAAAAETVSPLPILLWIAAPLLVAAASAVAAYAIDIASRRLRRLRGHRASSEPRASAAERATSVVAKQN